MFWLVSLSSSNININTFFHLSIYLPTNCFIYFILSLSFPVLKSIIAQLYMYTFACISYLSNNQALHTHSVHIISIFSSLHIYLTIFLSIYLSIYISIYLSIHQSIYCPKHQTISLSIFASCIKEMQKEKCKILLHTLRHCQMNPALYTAGFDVLLPYIDRMLSWKK